MPLLKELKTFQVKICQSLVHLVEPIVILMQFRDWPWGSISGDTSLAESVSEKLPCWVHRWDAGILLFPQVILASNSNCLY